MDGRFVVTILGRRIPEGMLDRVRSLLAAHGLTIEGQRWLSAPGQAAGYAAVELHANGILAGEAALRAALRSLADELQGEVIDELAKMAGVGDQVVAITASAMRGEIQFQESFRRRVGLLRGLPEARVYELLGRIPLMDGAERLFRTLRLLGVKTGVLSGGFTFFGSSLQDRLGIDHVFANVLEIADGVVTGEVRCQIVDGPRKAEQLQQLAAREGVPLEQVVAVGDGANDLPMLRLAGLGVAFHAKPVVRANAAVSLSHLGLDGLLYLLGLSDEQVAGLEP